MKNSLNHILNPGLSGTGNYSGYTKAQLDEMSAKIQAQETLMGELNRIIAEQTTVVNGLVDMWGKCNCNTLHNNNCACTNLAGAVIERDVNNVNAGRANLTRMRGELANNTSRLNACIATLTTLRKNYDEASAQYLQEQEASLTPEQKIALEKQRAENQARLAEVNAMGNSKTIIIAVVGLLVLAGGAMALWFYFKNKK